MSSGRQSQVDEEGPTVDQEAVNDMEELFYAILSFAGASKTDSDAAARRRNTMESVEPVLLVHAEAWDQAENHPTSAEIVWAWWRCVIAATYESTGITPEGTELSAKLKKKMFEGFPKEDMQAWENGVRQLKNQRHAEWRAEEDAKSLATAGSEASTVRAPKPFSRAQSLATWWKARREWPSLAASSKGSTGNPSG